MGLDLNAPYSPSNNGTPTINSQVLAEEYGFAFGFLNSVPELRNLFNQAVAQSWTQQKFTAELQTTNWWRTNSQAAREAQTLKAIDPQTYSSDLQQAQADIEQQAASMGAALSPQTLQTIAQMQVSNGWNTNQIAQALSKYVVEANRGGFGGLAGQNQINLSQYALQRGITIDDQTMKNFLQAIAGNKMSVEDFQGFIREQAASKYPAFAKELQAGTSLATLAAPYQQMAQKTLEIGPNATQLNSPLIEQGLNYMQQQGNQAVPTSMSMTDFQKFLQAQPQWKQTLNAQQATMATARQVLTDMGLAE
jgi:hypothetical protein